MIYKFYIPIFNYTCTVLVTEDEEKISETINHYFPDLDLDFEAKGYCIYGDGDIFLVAVNKNKDADYETLLMHELFHLTVGVMRLKGIDLIEETEEMFAVLHEHLHKEFKRIIEKENLQTYEGSQLNLDIINTLGASTQLGSVKIGNG